MPSFNKRNFHSFFGCKLNRSIVFEKKKPNEKMQFQLKKQSEKKLFFEKNYNLLTATLPRVGYAGKKSDSFWKQS